MWKMYGKRNTYSLWMASIVSCFVVAIVITLIALHPMSHLIWGEQKEIRMALVFDDESPVQKRLFKAAKRAIDEINQSVQEMFPKPPKILVKKISGLNTNRSELFSKKMFEDLKQKGLDFFFDLSPESEVTKSLVKQDVNCSNCLFEVFDPWMTKANQLTESIFQTTEIQMAKSYLMTINEFNHFNKTLDVLSVFSNQDESAKSFFETFLKSSKDYPNLKVSRPVVYESSQYKKSDAFQVVSDIGAKVTFLNNGVIFFITNQDIPFILEVAQRVNPELARHRWYVKDLWSIRESSLRENPNVSRFCSLVSLTSLSFLSFQDNRLQSHAFSQILKESQREFFGSLHVEAGLFAQIMNIHRKFTDKLVKEAVTKRQTSENNTISMSVQTFVPMNEIEVLPFNGWLTEAIINISKESINLTRIFTHPLLRREIKHTLVKSQCDTSASTVEIFLRETVLTPRSHLKYEIKAFPESLIVPASGGLGLRITCLKDTGQENNLTLIFSCVPKQLSVGELTCAAITSNLKDKNKSPEALARHHRSIEDNKDWTNIWSDMGQLWDNWKLLVPEIFSCTASVAGCDMCFYFLGTYNYSVVPAACVGGCTINTFDSCTGVISKSFIETVKKLF